jgi:hypothetical protein
MYIHTSLVNTAPHATPTFADDESEWISLNVRAELVMQRVGENARGWGNFRLNCCMHEAVVGNMGNLHFFARVHTRRERENWR